jgi:hypothetical protein
MFGMPPPKTEPRYLIHYVSGGKTLCGIPTPDLKRNERWVEPRGWDAHLANCDKCKARKKP